MPSLFRKALKKHPYKIAVASVLVFVLSIYISIKYPISSAIEMFAKRGITDDHMNEWDLPVAANDDIHDQNTGTLPWERHPLRGLPHTTKHMVPNAPSYEMDNPSFTAIFKKVFERPCTLSFKHDDWALRSFNEEVKDVYTGFLSWFEQKIKQIHPSLQVVHDRLLSVFESVLESEHLLLKLECTVYRLGRYHGKHIGMWVLYNRSLGTYQVIVAKIIGEISEETIMFHPITAFDPQKPSYAPNDPSSPTIFSAPPSLSQVEVEALVDRQQEKRKYAV